MSYIPLIFHQKDLLINIGSILTVCFQVGSKWSNYPSYIQYIFVDTLQNTIQIFVYSRQTICRTQQFKFPIVQQSKRIQPHGSGILVTIFQKIRNNLLLQGPEFYYKYYLMPKQILLFLMPTITIVILVIVKNYLSKS